MIHPVVHPLDTQRPTPSVPPPSARALAKQPSFVARLSHDHPAMFLPNEQELFDTQGKARDRQALLAAHEARFVHFLGGPKDRCWTESVEPEGLFNHPSGAILTRPAHRLRALDRSRLRRFLRAVRDEALAHLLEADRKEVEERRAKVAILAANIRAQAPKSAANAAKKARS